MRKIISLLMVTLIINISVLAQVNKVIIQASGLTCSMCSNAINKSLSTITFVSQIKSNIKDSEFEIFIKPNATVDFALIKKKVEDAGFFVARMEALMVFQEASVAPDTHLEIQGVQFHFLSVKPQTLNGETKIRFLDKGYLTAKEFKKNASLTKLNCFKTGKSDVCCEGKHNLGMPLYHVTL
jgi:copper chaperone CopZ